MDKEKSVDVTVHDENLAIESQRNDHKRTKWEAAKHQPLALAWIGWALFVLCLQGFDSTAGATITGIQQFRKDFGYPYNGNYVLYAQWQSAFTGGPSAMAVIGALSASFLRDRIGNRWSICLYLLNTYLGVALEFTATTNAWFLCGKMVNGLSIGAFNCLCVAYIAEISPLALRGVATCMCNFTLAVGPLVALAIVTVFGTRTDRWAYRSVFAAQWGFALIASVFAPFSPESPWYLIRKGQKDKVLHTLNRLGFRGADAEMHLASIEQTDSQARQETEGNSFRDLFRGTNLRRTLLTIMPLTVQALCGVSFVGNYSTYYYQLSGATVQRSFQYSLGAQGLSLAGDITSWFVVDRVGRRTLLIYGLSALSALLLTCGGLSTSKSPSVITGAVALFMMYNFTYNIVIGSVAYAVIPEIPTSRLRAKSIAISLACQRSLYTLQSFILPFIFNPDKGNLQGKTMFIYGVFAAIGVVMFYFFQPETARRSFEEIDEMFLKKVPAKDFKTYVTTIEKDMTDESK